MEPEIIDYEQGEKWMKVSYPDVLDSGGFGPCLVIGVYDPKTKDGHMLHVDTAVPSGDISEFLKYLREECGDLSRAAVYATGLAPAACREMSPKLMESERVDFARARERIEDALYEAFNRKKVTINWLPDFSTGTLRIYTARRKKFDLEIDDDVDLEHRALYGE